jgi:hypothetical protein
MALSWNEIKLTEASYSTSSKKEKQVSSKAFKYRDPPKNAMENSYLMAVECRVGVKALCSSGFAILRQLRSVFSL